MVRKNKGTNHNRKERINLNYADSLLRQEHATNRSLEISWVTRLGLVVIISSVIGIQVPGIIILLIMLLYLAKPSVMSVERIAEKTLQTLKDPFITKQRNLTKEMTVSKSERDRLCQEIRELVSNERAMQVELESRKKLIGGCETQQIGLNEMIVKCNEELSHLGALFHQMNSAVLGQSQEESNQILQSIRVNHLSYRDGPHSQSPLLQKYVEVLNILNEKEKDLHALLVDMVDLEIDAFEDKIKELKVMITRKEDLKETLLIEEETLLTRLEECDKEIHRLNDTVLEELISAMNWGISESAGLYQPDLSNAPLVLLSYRQHSHDQSSFQEHTASLPLSSQRTTETKAELEYRIQADDEVKEEEDDEQKNAHVYLESRNMNSSNVSPVMTQHQRYTLAELKARGHTPVQLKLQGYIASELREVGFTPRELISNGFSLLELHEGGYSLQELSRERLKSLNQCNGADLRAAGYTVEELLSAGYFDVFTVSELKNLGYSATQLKSYGFKKLTEFRNAGFTAGELLSAGFPVTNIYQLGYSLQSFKDSGASAAQLRKVGVWKARDLQTVGYTTAELLSAGYFQHELIPDPPPVQTMKLVHSTTTNLQQPSPCPATVATLQELRARGYTVAQLRSSGYRKTKQFREVGYTVGDLFKAGYTIHDIRQAGFTLHEFRDSSIPKEELKKIEKILCK